MDPKTKRVTEVQFTQDESFILVSCDKDCRIADAFVIKADSDVHVPMLLTMLKEYESLLMRKWQIIRSKSRVAGGKDEAPA